MTRVRFAKLYWTASLLLPPAAAAFGAVGALGTVGVVTVFGFYIVAIPYVPFAFAMTWWYWRAEEPRQVVRRASAWPLVFAPFALLYRATLAAFPAVPDPLEAWAGDPAQIGGLILALGYGYFLLALLGYGFIAKITSRTGPPPGTTAP